MSPQQVAADSIEKQTRFFLAQAWPYGVYWPNIRAALPRFEPADVDAVLRKLVSDGEATFIVRAWHRGRWVMAHGPSEIKGGFPEFPKDKSRLVSFSLLEPPSEEDLIDPRGPQDRESEPEPAKLTINRAGMIEWEGGEVDVAGNALAAGRVLVQHFGKTVTHGDLVRSANKDSHASFDEIADGVVKHDAPDDLRQAIKRLNKALSAAGVPFVVCVTKGVGYRLSRS